MSESIPNTISTRQEIEVLVNSFYDKVKQDELIGPVFNDTAKVNWDEHLPKLYNFWEDLLLGTNNYPGRPFPPHVHLNLKMEHFERWLTLFFKTIDENFTGLKAEEAKARALRIAKNFSVNLGLSKF
jgi:hemoglobin